ncbi:Phosphoglycolate phosphatase [Acholeplasma oculi]|uniref:Phosphoglycolate phosphatase n=1 Tax=Acholeplasma oculi TaxID=35623 RepID=A0A061AAC8_9MOLU|nr:HAD-IA family hydrolase [Acholeplasma oculi]CDR30855.1 Phosphoglycolate phosphatase [Acholeplasma oculi]SKC35294.1 phosphoglycolate phosphatase [Acholeplasma oculi]SUT89931.1 Phosphoglycolate phosphatase [Acholeplasma oculi]
MIRTIIFDLDGTILDTIQDLTNAVNYTLNQFKLPNITSVEAKSFLGYGASYLLNQAKKTSPIHTEDLLKIYIPYMESHNQIESQPYEGIMDLLNELKGKYRLGIVSNKHQEALDMVVDKYFKGYFDVVIGDQVNQPKKPDPYPLLKAIQDLDSSIHETLYIGDTEVDLKTAKNAHVKVVAVTWGFRSLDELKREKPNFIIDEPKQLKDLIKGENACQS